MDESPIRIPSLDLPRTYASLKREIDAAVTGVLASGRYIGGPEVESLEREFAALCGVAHAVSVASGTDALRFALIAAGVSGGEVITSPLSFIGSTEAITQAGARPIFADIDPLTFTLDPGEAARAITPRTRAILPVHLYGQTADMDPILDLAHRHGIAVIEDACQAHGAQDRGRAAGAIGEVGCFSFYPTKNLGGCGEGGMITTASYSIALRVRRLRDHGQVEKYHYAEEGYNGRLDALQAAILRVKLRHLPEWNERRRRLAARYREGLRGAAVRLPAERAGARHVYHQFTIRTAGRDRVQALLRERGIETGVHYPVPLHLQECYAGMGRGAGSFPESESAAREVLSLPIHHELDDPQVDQVCEAIRAVAGMA